MSDVHKKYVLIFMSIISVFLIIIVLISFYIQPLEGELTRLGSYSERDFGWNLTQKKIRGNANLVNRYDGKSDVLIIGDSFSTNGVWQPFFREITGFSYETIDIRKTSISEFMKSNAFRKNPPKIIILQCVERELVYFFKDVSFNCAGETNQSIRVPMLRYTSRPYFKYYDENRKTFDIQNINLKYVASVVIHSIFRNVTGKDTRHTKRFFLTNSNLFSNKKSDEILVYEADINKFSWGQNDIKKAACSIRGIQDIVQSNGKTLFVFVLVPDKSTAYADYISTPVFKNRENISNSLMQHGINIPRIDIPLKAAIVKGEKDIYIPSGTHWSARGYELAAEGISEFIKRYSL